MPRHALAVSLAAGGLLALFCVAALTMPSFTKTSLLSEQYVLVPLESSIMGDRALSAVRSQQLAASFFDCEQHDTDEQKTCCNSCQTKIGRAAPAGFNAVCVPVCEGWMEKDVNLYITNYCDHVEPQCTGDIWK